jgi:CDP-paratose 2-epimerase
MGGFHDAVQRTQRAPARRRAEKDDTIVRLLVTGGAGFIGSHVAESWAAAGHRVLVLDNLSRARLLGRSESNAEWAWRQLQKLPGVECVHGSVGDPGLVAELVSAVDAVVHAAAQTAVTTSVVDPSTDFHTNVVGTFTVLEAVRRSGRRLPVVFTSTNKVYGENINALGVVEGERRYTFDGRHVDGVSEAVSVDHCKHTPYGASKLAADLYVQEYARLYRLPTAVFRMSCIYGPRQFGVEDQGWVAHFVISMLTGAPITIYGDGKQVRDVLYVGDLVEAMRRFIEDANRFPDGLVCNIGGGPRYTLSLLELLDLLAAETGRRTAVRFEDWRPSDQRVYISDVGRAAACLGWTPSTPPADGIARLVRWVGDHVELFVQAPSR